jgi:DNA-binding MarR family transcriptional regulator
VSARLTRWASRHASLELPLAQARLLSQLEELGPVRVSELADADHSSQPTTTAAVQRLEARGWARREPDPGDARATLVSITEEGRSALAHVRRARAAALSPTLDALPEADLARLRDAVDALEALLDRAVTPPPPTREEA